MKSPNDELLTVDYELWVVLVFFVIFFWGIYLILERTRGAPKKYEKNTREDDFDALFLALALVISPILEGIRWVKKNVLRR